MRICQIGFLILFFNFNLSANDFYLLDFEQSLPVNNFSNLLKIVTQLFHDIKIVNLQDQVDLDRIINYELDIIGAIYLFKYQVNSFYMNHEDFVYLKNLMHTIILVFNDLKADFVSEQVQFIGNLLTQLQLRIDQLV